MLTWAHLGSPVPTGESAAASVQACAPTWARFSMELASLISDALPWAPPSLPPLLPLLAGALPLLPLLPPLLLALLALRGLHRLLFGPLEVVRAMHATGYLPPEAGLTREEMARNVARRRQRGDLPPVYPNGWYRVVDSSRVPPGQVVPAVLLGEQLAVFRSEQGQVSVLDAYCPHLGANLAVGGQVRGDCLECPFHGWRFRGEDGRCVHIPYSKRVPEFARVRSWASCERNGCVYAWFHCDGVEPSWEVPQVEEIASGEWRYRGRTEHTINAHIQEIPENAADVAHLNHLHSPIILSGSDLRFSNSPRWGFTKHLWDVQWSPEVEPNLHCSRMLLHHRVSVWGHELPLATIDVVARQVGPGLVFMNFDHKLLGRGVILHCVTPLEPLLQTVTHTIYYARRVPALVPKMLLRLECVQFERDLMIWNNKRYVSRPLLVKEDSLISRHRRWYSQFYSDNSPRYSRSRDSLDW
ncbi:cholesterol 7-desaturase nvd-like isoform X1 [Petromyzon marinus]|uniref:cholesterol 7-desaturase nvd-like isoform X1 n=2 Tax=Petromyzon marinus TaxID=7757 RepID=UPI003F726710